MQNQDPMSERKIEFDNQQRIDAERARSAAIARPDPAPAARAASDAFRERVSSMAGDGQGEPSK